MFSILVPAYKAKYLKQAIDSILSQQFRDFELIIINDKSQEDLDTIVNMYQDQRLSYYINEENLGGIDTVKNWNKCLGYASRPYSILFSDDDLLEPSFLQTMAKLINAYPDVNVFSARAAVIDSENNVIRYTASAPTHESALDMIWHRVYNVRDIFAQNFIFKTDKLKEIGGFVNFPLAWGTDDATWFTLAGQNGIVSTNEVLVYWRWSELNISNVGNITVRIKAVEEYYNWLRAFVMNIEAKNRTETDLKSLILSRLPKRKIDAVKNLIDLLLKNNNAIDSLKIYRHISKKYGYINKKLLLIAVVKKIVRRTN
jgi:glycosyltransferase involved in cell wall biosynthesis